MNCHVLNRWSSKPLVTQSEIKKKNIKIHPNKPIKPQKQTNNDNKHKHKGRNRTCLVILSDELSPYFCCLRCVMFHFPMKQNVWIDLFQLHQQDDLATNSSAGSPQSLHVLQPSGDLHPLPLSPKVLVLRWGYGHITTYVPEEIHGVRTKHTH